jgi:hypothetical protein
MEEVMEGSVYSPGSSFIVYLLQKHDQIWIFVLRFMELQRLTFSIPLPTWKFAWQPYLR